MKLKYYIYVLLFISACKTDIPEATVDSGYPKDIEKIIVGNCATPGCHNTTSKSGAAGLDLSTWDHMFDGTTAGAVTVPFRSDFSTLLYFTNTDPALGLINTPTMPVNLPALNHDDYIKLKNWIASGAPDINGTVAFADNPLRHKFYVTNQGCDVVAVFDADRKVIMRMVDVGISPGTLPYPESPHNVKVSPDGKFWMVVFLNSDVIQLFDASTDQLMKTIPIGNGVKGQWNTGVISGDSKKAYIADFSSGYLACVDLDAGTCVTLPPFYVNSLSSNLHGLFLNKTSDTLYTSLQNASHILKIPLNDVSNYQIIPLYPPGSAPTRPYLPHDIVFTPDYKYYLVTCQDTLTNKVVVMDAATDKVFTTITVGEMPQEIVVSPSHNLAFVTNTEDKYFPGVKGSVSMINLNTFTETRIQVGWQPHGIAVDEKKQLVYVANRNISGGPAPHHASACVGKNGYLSVIDLNTGLRIPNYNAELAVDPYSVSVRP